MKRSIIIGYFYGILSGIVYGFNPFFAKPMMDAGIGVDTILLFRYGFAAITMLIVVSLLKYSLKITIQQIFLLLLLGVLFALSSLFLFEAYKYISPGIATTIIFLYPLMVALILIFFKKYPSWQVVVSIIICFIGICFLTKGDNEKATQGLGIFLSSLGALSYAIFMVIVDRNQKIKRLPANVMTFYVLLFGCLIYPLYMLCKGPFPIKEVMKTISTPILYLNAIGLALFPTVVAALTVVVATKRIGPTKTSVFGVLEPATAVLISVFCYGDHLTLNIIIGLFLIVFAILFMICTRAR